LRCLRKP
jgi:hypothetical protein